MRIALSPTMPPVMSPENCRQNLCANTLSGTKKIRKFAEIIIKEWKK
jgi:hypothetical protein